jgi:hypothetical protein
MTMLSPMTLAEVACVGKAAFTARRGAEVAIKRTLRSRKRRRRRRWADGERMQPYRCPVCRLWHVGDEAVRGKQKD